MSIAQANISNRKVFLYKWFFMTGVLFCFFLTTSGFAQEGAIKPKAPTQPALRVDMTQSQMVEIVAELVGEYEGAPNNLQFVYNKVPMALISDQDNNRMRLLAPIISVDDLSDDFLQAAMVSNFHLALDARYAATYIHPLKELTKDQLQSAIRQVSSLRSTFGSTFTSGELLYGGRNPEEQEI